MRTCFSIRRVLVFVGSLVVLSSGAAIPQTYDYRARSEAPPLEIRSLGGSLYMTKGEWGANTGFFAGKDGVLVIDAKTTVKATRKVVDEIQKITPKPITRVVFTHSDPDVFNGRAGYPDGTEVLCSYKTYAEWSYERLFYGGLPVYLEMDAPASLYQSWPTSSFVPAATFSNQLTIRFGPEEIEFLQLGPAHTSGDIAVCFLAKKIAFVGDVVFGARDPLIQDFKGGHVYGLVRALSLLLNHRPEITTFIPSHAEPINREELKIILKSVEETHTRVMAMVDAGKTLDEVKRAFGVQDPPKDSSRWRWPSLALTVYRELTRGRTDRPEQSPAGSASDGEGRQCEITDR